MDHFQQHDGVLCADGVPLTHVAETYGTPTYVYSQATLQRHVRVLGEGLASLPHRICYAVKANGNLSLLRLLGELGCSFDAVSLGELMRVQRAGQPLGHTIFSGVGKSDQEIDLALKNGVLYLSVESHEELLATAAIGQRQGRVAPVSIRVNPDVDAHTHPYISTGMAENKFGVPVSQLPALVRTCLDHPHLDLVGLTCHIGSQLTTLAPFEDAAHRIAALTQEVREAGVTLRHVGMGGGLGIPYHQETPPDPARYGAALARILGPLELEVVLEPGRVIVGNAGVLLASVVRCKDHGAKHFAVIDAGMNDLLRPALYQAHHTIEAVVQNGAPGRSQKVDVVGPVCESADTFAKDLALQQLEPGALVAIRSAGAYGFVMASHYNGRPKPAEVLCHDGKMTLIRARETFEDLWRQELL